MNIYEEIGAERIATVIRDFYRKAFEDPMLAHFFMNLDHDGLVAMQVDFACSMLGGPQSYRGKPLTLVHDPFLIRPPHFKRRQRILEETLEEQGVDRPLIEAWLKLEEKLKPLIMKDQGLCSDS